MIPCERALAGASSTRTNEPARIGCAHAGIIAGRPPRAPGRAKGGTSLTSTRCCTRGFKPRKRPAAVHTVRPNEAKRGGRDASKSCFIRPYDISGMPLMPPTSAQRAT